MGGLGQRLVLAVGLSTHDHRKGDGGSRAVIVATLVGARHVCGAFEVYDLLICPIPR